MSYRIQTVHRCIWDDRKSEIIELPEIYCYRVLGTRGQTLAEGNSRAEALRRASERILLPA